MNCGYWIELIDNWLEASWEAEQNSLPVPEELRVHAAVCTRCAARLEAAKQLAGSPEYLERSLYRESSESVADQVMERISHYDTADNVHRADSSETGSRKGDILTFQGKLGVPEGKKRNWLRRVSLAAAAVILVAASSLITGYITKNGTEDYIVVHLTVELPQAAEVAVVGDWNGWDPGIHRMVNIQGSDTWEIKLQVEPGREYRYQFVIDGNEWIPDPRSTLQVEDGFGGINSVLEI